MSSALIEEIRAAGGERMHGPSALAGSWRRTVALTWTLAYLEFRLKFFGSVLGYLWQLGRPLAMFGVYYVIFTQVINLGDGVKYYAAMLLASIMLFQFYSEVTGGSVMAVVDRESLVRKIHFPRIVIPLSVVVGSALTLGVNMLAIGVFMIIQQVPVTINWLAAIPALGMLFVLVTGLAMLLSALFVRARDVKPIWDVILQAAFYASPILYPIESVTIDSAKTAIMMNPLSVVIQQIRHSVFDPATPSAKDAIGGYPLLAIPILLTIGIFVLGFWVFNRSAPDVAENL